jgi:hypothetical protein
MINQKEISRVQENFTLKKTYLKKKLADFLFPVLFISHLDFLVRHEPAKLIATSWWRANVDSISPNIAAAHKVRTEFAIISASLTTRSFRRYNTPYHQRGCLNHRRGRPFFSALPRHRDR